MIFGVMIWINMILDQAGTAMAVIGWIQFGLLTLTIGLPLLLLVIFMIVPIKYDFKGALCEAKEFSDEEGEDEDEPKGVGEMVKKMVTDLLLKITSPIKGNGKFSWLAGLVKGEIFYQHRELSWKVKIFVKKISSEDASDQEEEAIQAAEDKKAQSKLAAMDKKEDGVLEGESEKRVKADLENTAGQKVGASLENKAEQKVSASLENKAEQKVSASLENKGSQKVSVSLENKAEQKVSASLENKKSKKSGGIFEGKQENESRKTQETKVQDANVDETEDTLREGDESKEQDKNFFEKAGDFFEKIEEGYENINEKMEYTYEQICDKIDLVSEGKAKITDFIYDETHQGAYRKLVGELKRLLKAVKPTKIKGNLKVGFEDPRTTGLFIAGASLIYPYTGGNANLEADFDEKALEGDLRIKGKLRIGSLAWFATKMAVNKDVQATVKDIVKLVPKKGGS